MTYPGLTPGDTPDEQTEQQDSADTPPHTLTDPTADPTLDLPSQWRKDAASYPATDPAAYAPDAADAVETEGTATSSRQMPRVAIIIASVIVLIAIIGVSVGILFTRQPNSDEVIVRVGDQTLTRGDFLRNHPPGHNAQETLDQLIEFKLVVQEAQAAGVTVDQAIVDEQIAQFNAQYDDPAMAEQFLQSQHIDSQEELRDVLGQMQLYNAAIRDHIVVEQAHARHILLAAQDEGTDASGSAPAQGQPLATKAERKVEAEELMAQLEEGADFAELAQEHSEDPGSAQEGGDLGWAPRGVFVPSFEEAIFSMEPGETRLVESQFGWHIIELIEAPETRPLENTQFMQSPVVQAQIDAALLPWLEGLRTKAEESNQIEILVEPMALVPPAPTLPMLPTVQP